MTARFGCVVLTMGRRPDQLKEAVESLLRQRGVEVEVVVVGNGCHPDGMPPEVHTRRLPHNTGIPAGRNAGVQDVGGDLLVFLDDDASLPDDDTLQRLADRLEREPDIGLVQLHPVDPDGNPTPGRWIPRLHVGDENRSSDVCAVWEGAVVARRCAFEATGGWPAQFFYMHEGIDLAWRVWDAGYRVHYAGDVRAYHPVGPGPTKRHAAHHRYSARNRVWLARRNLPLPLGVTYLATWMLLSAARTRRADEGRELLRGMAEGLLTPCQGRHPISWRTAWRMTRAGRPPVV